MVRLLLERSSAPIAELSGNLRLFQMRLSRPTRSLLCLVEGPRVLGRQIKDSGKVSLDQFHLGYQL